MRTRLIGQLLLLCGFLGAPSLPISAEDRQLVAGADDLVVVVLRENGVPALSRAEVFDIFMGRSRSLPDGRRVVPLDLGEGSILRDRFYQEVLERSPAQVRAHWARLLFTGRGSPPRSVDSLDEVLLAMKQNPQSIAYLPRRVLTPALAVVYE